MKMNYPRVAAALCAVLILSGCQTGGTDGNAKAHTETPAAGDIFAPEGTDGATVTIEPVGQAQIGIVNGMPAKIRAGATAGEYRAASLPPGDHILNVSMEGMPQGMNLTLRGKAGRYYARTLTYLAGGTQYWTPVIVSGKPDGPIVADKDGLLLGKTPAEAVKILAAAASRPATPDENSIPAEAASLFEKASASYKAKRMGDSLKALDAALAIHPSFDTALTLRGVVLARMKRPKEALQSLDEAIRVAGKKRGEDDPWLHWPWMEKGLVLMAARKPKPALTALGRSIRLKPTERALTARADLNFAMGNALGKKDDWDGAEPYFKGAQADASAAIAMRPKSTKLWSLKAATHIMLNEHDQACTSIRKACEFGDCSMLEQFPQCKPGS